MQCCNIYHPTSDDAAALGQSWAIRIFKPLNSFTFTESTVDPNKIETILFANQGGDIKQFLDVYEIPKVTGAF